MKHTSLAAIVLSLLFTVGACGDDEDLPMIDAPVVTIDAVPAIDATPPRPDCEVYCECMPVNCPGSFPDTATCMSTCEALDVTNQDCRKYHCSVAVGADTALHCPHARGEAICL